MSSKASTSKPSESADTKCLEPATFTDAKIEHVSEAIFACNIKVAGRERTGSHRRQDHAEAMSAMLTNPLRWRWSDQRLEQEFIAACRAFDKEKAEKQESPVDDDEQDMIKSILAEMRKRKGDDEDKSKSRFEMPLIFGHLMRTSWKK